VQTALSKYRFEKLFSLQEANELIPKLEVLVRELQAAANELRAQICNLMNAEREVATLALDEVIERHPEVRPAATRMAELASQIESLGCLLKDIDLGLVDFPAEITGHDMVFLCWQSGEPHVLAWHPVEGGFAERKPLAGAPKTYLN
jgi:hypothetical protein